MTNILMIDDDIDDQYFYHGLFSDVASDITFRGISSKDELDDFLAALKSGGVDVPRLILLDLNFPKISGKEIFKVISVNQYLKKTPVLALTTSSSPIDMKDCHDLGFSAYFVKPSEYQECKKLVRTLYDYWFEFNAINEF